MLIREATLADIPQLVELRMQLFAEVGEISDSNVDPELRVATERFFMEAAENGQAKTWLAILDGITIASGTLAIFIRPPYPGNLAGQEAYLLNMYTLPAYRRKKAAKQILERMMSYARSQGFGKVWLHASVDGRPLYERFGFASNPSEMEWPT